MRISFMILFLFVSLCGFGQALRTPLPDTVVAVPDTAKSLEQIFNDYLVGQKQYALEKYNDSIVLVHNLQMLNELLKKPMISSPADIAMLRAIDNVCPEISLRMDSSASADSIQNFSLVINGTSLGVYDNLDKKSKSGLLAPSRNVNVSVIHLLAAQVEVLPRRSNSLSADTAAYMNRIKSLVKSHEAQLRSEGITIAAYQEMEKGSGLRTAQDYLNFRASFIRFLFEQYQIYQR